MYRSLLKLHQNIENEELSIIINSAEDKDNDILSKYTRMVDLLKRNHKCKIVDSIR